MAGYVSSAAEDPPEERTECRACGGALCQDCGACLRTDWWETFQCQARACICPRISIQQARDMGARWQEALDDAEDAAVDDAKVRELEGS